MPKVVKPDPQDFACRIGCGACCIAISISSPIPGMPYGKPAGVRCVNLSPENVCLIHGTDAYPEVCRNLTANREMCGDTREEAIAYLTWLEAETAPVTTASSGSRGGLSTAAAHPYCRVEE